MALDDDGWRWLLVGGSGRLEAVGGGRLWCGRRSGARRARREAEEECVGSWEAAGGRGTGRGVTLFSLPFFEVVLCPSGPTLSPTTQRWLKEENRSQVTIHMVAHFPRTEPHCFQA